MATACVCCLFVKGGSHSWRFDYTFDGRRKTVSFGTYPATTLEPCAQEWRTRLANRCDSGIGSERPEEGGEEGESTKARLMNDAPTQGLPPTGSFEAVAREWYEKNAPNWAATHSEKIIRRLERDVFPWIGAEADRIDPPCRPAGVCSGEWNREGRSRQRIACSKTAARSFDTPSRRHVQRAIRVGTCEVP